MMMKRIANTILVLLIFLCFKSYGQYVRGFYNNEKINGRVVSVTDIECYQTPEGAVDSNISVINYNSKGEAIEQRITKRYDRRFSNPILGKIDTNQFYPQSTLSFLYYYGKDDKLKTVVATMSDSSKAAFKYNGSEQMEKHWTYSNGQLSEATSLSYDKNGNLKRMSIYSLSKKITIVQEYKYDKNNLMTEEIVYRDGVNSYTRHYTYLEFDIKNNWTKCKVYNSSERELYTSIRQIKYAD
jgi:hypothetical protein